MHTARLARAVTVVFALALASCNNSSNSFAPGTVPTQLSSFQSKINHIVVVYQENWSFDALYGSFPGANGLANAASAAPQVDKSGVPLATLPQPLLNGKPDPRFPAGMPVAPFSIVQYVAPTQLTGDLIHRFYTEQAQIDGGKMDKYVAWTDSGGLTMGNFDASGMPEGQLAKQYTIADNFFHSAFGGSFLNHQWLICACTPPWPNAPTSKVATLNPDGTPINDGAVTPDGFAVNTSFSLYAPHPASITDTSQLVPPQTQTTIGDELSTANQTWAWYSGGWNNALAGNPDPLFQYHHQPFVYYKNFADGTPAKAAHLKDEQDFYAALQSNSLPAVSFVKFLGPDNEHPGYANLQQGQSHVAALVQQVQNSSAWKDTMIVITYDENGGLYDHVAPPVKDRWGPGTRVPAIIISPYAKRGFIDHTQYETVSILKTIEERFNLPAMTARDAAATDLLNAFDFSQKPQSAARKTT